MITKQIMYIIHDISRKFSILKKRRIMEHQKYMLGVIVCLQMFQIHATSTEDGIQPKLHSIESSMIEQLREMRERIEALEKGQQECTCVKENSQIAFTAYHAEKYITNPGDKIVMDTPITNIGGAFSTETGDFVCPVNGLYYFSATSFVQDGGNSVFMEIMHDSSPLTTAMASNPWDQGSTSVVISCNAGSTVWLRHSWVEAAWLPTSGGNAAVIHNFTGFLISIL